MQVDMLKKKMEIIGFYDSVNENKALLKEYADVWNEIKYEIKAINGGKKNDYRKDNVKIKFNSGDDKPLKQT